MDKISVIIPVYNTAPYLKHCLDSVLAQTYQNLEVILIDDGSTDGSGELCDTYGQQDGRIVVLHQENKGQSHARNQGLACATGNYIAFLDSDDYLDEKAYETLYELCQREGASIGWMQFVSVKDGAQDCTPTQPLSKGLTSQGYLALMLRHRQCDGVWDKLYTRWAVEHLRFYDGVVNEDFRFLLDLFLQQNHTVAVTDYPGYYYRQRTGSTVNRPFGKLEQDCLGNALYAEGEIQQYCPVLLPSARGHTLFCVAAIFANIPLEQATMDNLFYAHTMEVFHQRRKEVCSAVLPVKFRVFLVLCRLSVPFAKRLCALYQRMGINRHLF